MTPEEQNLIENLFDRLREADVNPKDPEAEQLIHAKTAALPSAPYLFTQAVLVAQNPGSKPWAVICYRFAAIRLAHN